MAYYKVWLTIQTETKTNVAIELESKLTREALFEDIKTLGYEQVGDIINSASKSTIYNTTTKTVVTPEVIL
jgi:hypothetical protein